MINFVDVADDFLLEDADNHPGTDDLHGIELLFEVEWWLITFVVHYRKYIVEEVIQRLQMFGLIPPVLQVRVWSTDDKVEWMLRTINQHNYFNCQASPIDQRYTCLNHCIIGSTQQTCTGPCLPPHPFVVI